jgi:bifunctional DNase/RNase
MIEMTLVGVRVELPTNQPIVLLKENDGDRYLPIWIGSAEAQAIASALQGVVAPRPMTHDLMRDLLRTLEVGVQKIEITELREQTFYALIHLARNGSTVEVSSRPSDAIALAVRMSVPIFASEDVLDDAAIRLDEEDETEENEEVERFREFLDQVKPEDFA